jgi:hypothetical protein
MLTDTQMKLLESYYRSLLWRIQSLPEQTASVALYILIGLLPFEAKYHIRTLVFFGRLVNAKDSLPREIVLRQLATKNMDSHSWLIYVVKIADKYNLPDLHSVAVNPPSIEHWKSIVKRAVFKFWEQKLIKDAQQKPSLKYLNIDHINFSRTRNIWKYTNMNTRSVQRSIIKARLLTGTLNLHGRRLLFGRPDLTFMCPLCAQEPESRCHFIAVCPVLQTQRRSLMEPVLEMRTPEAAAQCLADPEMLTQVILDHTHPEVMALFQPDPRTLDSKLEFVLCTQLPSPDYY